VIIERGGNIDGDHPPPFGHLRESRKKLGSDSNQGRANLTVLR
jgi:hypothetical protein